MATALKSTDGSMSLTGANAFTDLRPARPGDPRQSPPWSAPVTPPRTSASSASSPKTRIRASGFSYPHLFSAPFNIDVGDGHDHGDQPGDGSAPALLSTSATNSTVTASRSSVTADGVNTSRITVTLRGHQQQPGDQREIGHLVPGGGSFHHRVRPRRRPPMAPGQAVFTVTDTTAEPVTYTATDTSDSLAVTQTAAVTFAAPVVTPANSSIAALSSAVAQGGSTTITVTLKDQGEAPQPVAGKVVSLEPGERQLGDRTRVERVGHHQRPGPGHLHRVGRQGRDGDLLGDRYQRHHRPHRPECQRHVREPDRLGDAIRQ